MSASANRTILLKTRVTPTEILDTGEAYVYLNGNDLFLKDGTQTVTKLNLSTKDTQAITGAMISSGNDRLTTTYNAANGTLVLQVDESKIIHQNLNGAGVNSHAQIDSNIATAQAHWANTSNPHQTTKAQVGLSNVPNTDATLRANHTGTQTASTVSDFSAATDARITAQKGAVNGLATLDATQKIPLTQIPTVNTDLIGEGGTNKYFTEARVLTTALSGFALGSGNISAADTLIQALGKLQNQLNASNESQVTSNLSTVSALTLSNINDLTMTVTSGKKYRIQCHLLYQSESSGTGLALSFGNTNATGTFAGLVQIPSGGDGTAAMYEGNITSFGDVVTSTATPQANVPHIALIHAIFICTNSGTIYPQFRSEVTLSTVTIMAGSNMRIREF